MSRGRGVDGVLTDRPNLLPRVARFLPVPGSVRRPTFLVGCGRSGKTVLAELLGRHPEVALYPGEANHLWHPRIYPWRDSPHRSEVPPIWFDPVGFAEGSLRATSRRDVRVLKGSFRAYQLLRRRPVLLNESALIAMLLPFIVREFHGARIVHMVRDGRAAATAWARRQYEAILAHREAYRSSGYDVDLAGLLERCASSWDRQVREVRDQGDRLGLAVTGRLLEIRYEDFCHSPVPVLVQVCEHLRLDPDPLVIQDLRHLEDWNARDMAGLPADALSVMERIMASGLDMYGYGRTGSGGRQGFPAG